MERGDLRYVLLDLLKDRPSYGYELIQALEERFHGFYTPSAGTVYPTLQWLQDLGYLSVAEQDGRGGVGLPVGDHLAVKGEVAVRGDRVQVVAEHHVVGPEAAVHQGEEHPRTGQEEDGPATSGLRGVLRAWPPHPPQPRSPPPPAGGQRQTGPGGTGVLLRRCGSLQ